MIGFEGAPRYPRLLAALTGDTEIVPPGLILEVDRPEWSLLKQERLWMASFRLAALAGNFNEFALVYSLSAAVPDQLSVITHLWTDQISRFGIVSIAGAVAGPGTDGGTAFRDGRRAGKPSILQFNKQAVAQIVTGTGYGLLSASAMTAMPPVVIAGTGATFVVESTAQNVAQNLVVFGYERVQRPEERSE